MSDNITSKLEKGTNELIKRISGINIRKNQRAIDNVILFVGASGGTGTSTILSNIAYEMSEKNLSVIVIDLNVIYPIQHNYLGIKGKYKESDLVSFLQGRVTLGEAIQSKGNISLMYADNRNIIDYVHTDSKIASENLTEAISRLRSLFDMVLIDVSKFNISNDVVNTALFYCDTIYTVWDESVSSLIGANKIIESLELTGINSAKINSILNKRNDIPYRIEDIGEGLIGILPFDENIIKSSLNGEIFCKAGASFSKRSAVFCTEIKEITDKILNRAGLIE